MVASFSEDNPQWQTNKLIPSGQFSSLSCSFQENLAFGLARPSEGSPGSATAIYCKQNKCLFFVYFIASCGVTFDLIEWPWPSDLDLVTDPLFLSSMGFTPNTFRCSKNAVQFQFFKGCSHDATAIHFSQLKAPFFERTRKQFVFLDLCHCSMWTYNWILCEPV